MKKIDILRKLGVFRSGKFKAKYRNAKERPYALMDDSVFDDKKDLTTKEDLRKLCKKIKRH